eukprot:1144878-Pelagomonas_calceolata.AAC.2
MTLCASLGLTHCRPGRQDKPMCQQHQSLVSAHAGVQGSRPDHILMSDKVFEIADYIQTLRIAPSVTIVL